MKQFNTPLRNQLDNNVTLEDVLLNMRKKGEHDIVERVERITGKPVYDDKRQLTQSAIDFAKKHYLASETQTLPPQKDEFGNLVINATITYEFKEREK